MKVHCRECNYRFEQVPGADAGPPPAERPCPHCGAMVDVAAQVAAMAAQTTDEGHGAGPPTSHAGLAQRSFGEYDIIEEVSRGAMGVVYKARHHTLGRVVALKVMIAGEHASPDQVTRFDKEARAAAKLRHPNIVPIYDVGNVDGKRYFTMDFIEGTPLDVLISSHALIPRRALEIASEVADALAYAHRHGVIHRDVKPGNIIVDRAGRPQIMDFGLAKQVDSDTKFTKTGTTIGTPSYMSAEQARGENARIDHRTDVYSLGAVMYEMLTGRPPFTGETMMNIVMKVIHDEPVPLRRLNAKLHRDIQTIVLKAMEKDVGRRYPTMAELADDIRRYMAGEMIAARPAGPFRRVAKLVRKHRAAIIVGLVIASLATTVSGAIIHILIDRQRDAQRRAENAEQRRLDGLKDQDPEWVIKFSDDFGQAKLARPWQPANKEWTLKDGQLQVTTDRSSHVLLGRAFDGKIAIEFTATAQSSNARINCFLGRNPRIGYSFRFGNIDGHTLSVRRSLGRRRQLLAQVDCEPIQPGATYRFRVEHDNTSLRYRVTGGGQTHEIHYEDPELLADLGRIEFGFDTWASTVHFDRLRISRKEVAGERLKKRQAVDFLYLSKGLLGKALEEYRTVATKQPGTLSGVLAEHHCGLILEAQGRESEDKLQDALRHYQNVVRYRALLTGKDEPIAARTRERLFFVQTVLGQYKRAADELRTFCSGGGRLSPSLAWKFPAVLARCAGDFAYEPALEMMETARFDGARPTLRDQWAAMGGKVRANFGKAVSDLCRAFGERKRYDEMKRVFLALPDPGAAPAFEGAAAKAVAANDTPIALDLLAFARRHGLQTAKLEQSAVALAQQFLKSKQYTRIANVHTAYPSRQMARLFNRAVVEIVRAGELPRALNLLDEACQRFPKDRRALHEAGNVVMGACAQARRYEELRLAYTQLGDVRFARRLADAVAAQLKANDAEGAFTMLEFIRTELPAGAVDLRRLPRDLAAKLVADGKLARVIDLSEKYPTSGMPAPFAAAINMAAAEKERELLEKLMVRALARHPGDSSVVAAAGAAAASLVTAGEAERVLEMYQDAAQARQKDPRGSAITLLNGARVLLAGRANAQAASAYLAAARTAPDEAEQSAEALLRAATLYDHLGEAETAQLAWFEIVEKHPQADEVQFARLMTGALSTDKFKTWAAENAKTVNKAEAMFYLALAAERDAAGRAAAVELFKKVIELGKGLWIHPLAETRLQDLAPPAAILPLPPDE